MKNIPRNIIISRTDSIGDVVLTLPVAAVLKKHFPDIRIGFMGKSYTRPVIEACKYIDEFIDVETFLNEKPLVGGEPPACIIHVFPVSRIAKRAKELGIPLRIGTTNRLYHWWTCNKLVKLSRKKSDLHESQLNLVLLQPLGINTSYSLQELIPLFGLEKIQPLPAQYAALIKKEKYNLIIHPKSQGNGREWPLDNVLQLIKLLDKNKFNIFISGTDKEKEALRELFEQAGDAVTDITGKMTLPEFIAFIQQCDGLLASGTGPLHITAALGNDALGLFPPIRPIHPGRWAPIGPKATVFVLDKPCDECRKDPTTCSCLKNISAAWVKETLDKKYQDKLASTKTS